jgi:hypothetical protein
LDMPVFLHERRRVTNGYDYYGALHLQAQAVPRIGKALKSEEGV